MQKPRILYLSPKSRDDLEQIYKYTYEEWGMEQAEKYQDDLYEGMNLILLHPELGKVFKSANRQYRSFNVRRHILFYKEGKVKIVIVRILHNQMDIENRI